MSTFKLPPLRKLILPDPGNIIIDVDMSGADAQVVAWEANDEPLKDAFRKGVKIHKKNFEDFYQKPFEERFKYEVQPGKIYSPYDEMKRAVHATNYVAHAKTVAGTLQWKISEAEAFQSRWFKLHPGIKEWHRRVERELQFKRTITNRFGYRIVYFERPETCLAQAVAWGPQSTVAILAAKAAVNIRKYVPWAQVLMQVHDSVVFQVPFSRFTSTSIGFIQKIITRPVPYPDPLIIPWSIAASQRSWGDCKSTTWEDPSL